MEKEKLGAFIAENRKALGMTQKDLAARLHITDKAVSKWERGLSFPDVTLLEPLAAAFGIGVTELAACNRDGEATAQRTEQEESLKTVLRISNDSLRTERGRGRRWVVILAAALLVALTVLIVVLRASIVTEQGMRVIRHKEVVGKVRYLFLEQDGHLLRLKCGDDVDYDSIELKNRFGMPETLWKMTYRWNRRTGQGIVVQCEREDSIALVSPMEAIGSSTDMAVIGNDALFGNEHIMVETVNCYPNPKGQGYISAYTFWKGGDDEDWYTHANEYLLNIKDCLGYVETPGQPIDGGFRQSDIDGDGENELLVRTPWPEKPCILYDMEKGDVTETWLDTIPPEMNTPYDSFSELLDDTAMSEND